MRRVIPFLLYFCSVWPSTFCQLVDIVDVPLKIWKIVPRLLDGGIEEVPSQSFTVHTASLCGMQCQLRQSCQLFRFNILTTECDLYDGIAFRKISNVTGNRFFQKMPSSCVTGQDEWFPEYQTCIWIPTYVYSYEEAKNKCEAVGKDLMGTENFSLIRHLINIINAKDIYVYSRRIGANKYQWSNGTMIPPAQWCPDQPKESKDCVGVVIDRSWCPDGGLDDIHCNNIYRFFCV